MDGWMLLALGSFHFFHTRTQEKLIRKFRFWMSITTVCSLKSQKDIIQNKNE